MSISKNNLMTKRELIACYLKPTGFTLKRLEDFFSLKTYVHYIYMPNTRIEDVIKLFQKLLEIFGKIISKIFTENGLEISKRDADKLGDGKSKNYQIRVIKVKIISTGECIRLAEVKLYSKQESNSGLIVQYFHPREVSVEKKESRGLPSSRNVISWMTKIFSKRSSSRETIQNSICSSSDGGSRVSQNFESSTAPSLFGSSMVHDETDEHIGIVGQHVNGVEYLGAIVKLPLEGAEFVAAETYKNCSDNEWKRLSLSPKVTTKLWSAPYLTGKTSSTSQAFMVMFSLENYSFQQFRIRTKVLSCNLIKEKLKLPFKFQVVVSLKLQGDKPQATYSESVSGEISCDQLDAYLSEEILVPFCHSMNESFPGLKIQVVK